MDDGASRGPPASRARRAGEVAAKGEKDAQGPRIPEQGCATVPPIRRREPPRPCRLRRRSMKTVGALLWEPGTNSGWSVEEIELDGPKRREVTVKLTSSGICHSDDHLDTGDIPLPWAPVLGGHEGAGVVTEVGPEVHDLAEGDHVVLSFLPSCGRCRMCVAGRGNMCELGAGVLAGRA